MPKRKISFNDREGKKIKQTHNTNDDPQAGPSSVKCLYCDSRFQSEYEKDNHISRVHRQHSSTNKCNFCTEEFNNYYGKHLFIYYLIISFYGYVLRSTESLLQ